MSQSSDHKQGVNGRPDIGPDTSSQPGQPQGGMIPYSGPQSLNIPQHGSYAGNTNHWFGSPQMAPLGHPLQGYLQQPVHQVGSQSAPSMSQGWHQSHWTSYPPGPLSTGYPVYQSWYQENPTSGNSFPQIMTFDQNVQMTYQQGGHNPNCLIPSQTQVFDQSNNPNILWQVNPDQSGQLNNSPSQPRNNENSQPPASYEPANRLQITGLHQPQKRYDYLTPGSNQSPNRFDSQTPAPHKPQVLQKYHPPAPNQTLTRFDSLIPGPYKPPLQQNSQIPAQHQHKDRQNHSITSSSYSPQKLEQSTTSKQHQTLITTKSLIGHSSPTSSTSSPSHSMDQNHHSEQPTSGQAKLNDKSQTSGSIRPTVGQEDPSHSTKIGDSNARSMSPHSQMGQGHYRHSKPLDSGDSLTAENQVETNVYKEDTVLVKELDPDTNSEDLINYLEKFLDMDVLQLKYSSDRTMVIVTVEGRVQDLEVIQKKLGKLKGKIPVLSHVQQPTAVAVQCQATCKLNDIRKYFGSPASGNSNRCNVLELLKVHDADVLMFENAEVVRQIVRNKDHILCGQEVEVEEYYKEVGCPVWSEDSRTKPIEISPSMLQIRILQTLNFTENLMKKYKGLKISLSKTTVSMDGPRDSVQHAEKMLKDYLEKMEQHKRSAGLSQMKARLLDHHETEAYVKRQLISQRVQSAWMCRRDEDRYDVTVTALSMKAVDDTVDFFERTLSEADIEADLSDAEFLQLEKDLQKQNQCFFLLNNQGTSVLIVAIKDFIDPLEKQIKEHLKRSKKRNNPENEGFLCSFTPKLQNVKAKFIYEHMKRELEDQWKVKITREGRHKRIKVWTKGQEQEEIRKAFDDLEKEVLVFEDISQEGPYISTLNKRGLLPVLAQFVEKTRVCSVSLQTDDNREINQEWREGVWQVSDRCKVHAVYGDIPYIFDAIMVTVDSNLKPVGSFSEEVHQKAGRSELGMRSMKRLVIGEVISTHAGSYQNAKAIFQTCVKKDHESFLDLQKNVGMIVTGVLNKAHTKRIDSLALPAFTNGSGMSQTFIATAVVKAIQSFARDSETMLKDIYLLCNDISTLTAYETNMKIILEPGNVQLGEEARMGQESEATTGEEIAKREIRVQVVTGYICDEEVDVIVNTVGPSLKLDQGAISKALLQKGGEKLQNECNTRYPKGTIAGEFARTKGTGSLQCKEVFHCCLPSSISPEKLMILRSLMDKMLKAAAESRYSSIALPSLGTGNLGYKVENVAPILFDCIRLHQRKDSTIKDIRFVIYHKDVVILNEYRKLQTKFECKGEKKDEIPTKVAARSYASVAAGGSTGSLTTPQRIEKGSPSTLMVQIVEGAIAEQKVDVIANSVNSNLILTHGAVSKSILNKGGQDIQKYVLEKYPNGVRPGHFVVSHGGYLNCKNIYHCCVPPWGWLSDSGEGNIAVLHSLVLRCLDEASANNFESIAFPAFGTGNLNHPRETVARVMSETVTGYLQKRRHGCTLRNVYFVVYGQDKATMSAFLKETSKPLATAPERARPRTTTSQSWNMAQVTVTLKHGDIHQEQTYCAVVSVAHSMDLTDGTISRRLVSEDRHRGSLLQKNFSEKKNQFLETGMTVLGSNETCVAHVLILVDREMIHKDQQQVLLRCLDFASSRKFKSLALPILASGGKPETAADMARDLHAALGTFRQSNPKGLDVVNVVVFEETQFRAFQQGFDRVFNKTHETAPPIPNVPKDSVVVRQSKKMTTRVEYTLASNSREQLKEAEAMLVRLNMQSDQLQEEIFDERIPYMTQANVLELTALSKEDVKVICSKQGKKIRIEGDSLKVCEALKDVLQLISELPPRNLPTSSTNQNNIQQTLKSVSTTSSKEAASLPGQGFMSVEEGRNLSSSMNLKDLEAKKLEKKVDSKHETRSKPHSQDTFLVHEDVDEEDLHGMGKPEKILTKPSPENNELNGEETHPKHKFQDSGPPSMFQNLASSKTKQENDEDVNELCFKLSNFKIDTTQICSISAQIGSNSNNKVSTSHQMGSTSSQIGSNYSQMGSNSSHLGYNSLQMGSNSSQMGSNSSHLSSNSLQMGSNSSHLGSNSLQMGSNSSQMGSNSSHMGSNSSQMGSNSSQMGSNSVQKGSDSPKMGSGSPEMNTNSSPVNTDQYKMDTTPNPAESADPAEQDDTETDTKIEWFCVNDTESGRELQSYEPMNEKIESMYLRGEGSVVLPGEDEEYVIDFSTMEEYVKGSEEDKVSVVRREILPATESDVPLPTDLKNLSSDSKLVLVDRTSQEFDTIRSRFLRASRDAKVTVVKIEKMLNVSVYKNYQRKKNQILGSGALTPGDHVERSLWHGPLVNTDSIVNLSSFGFNRSYCNSAGERQCGDGVYFYPFADTILARSKMDASGHHHVCLAKVLTGRLEEADSSTLSVGRMRRLPKGCHSVVDHKSMPTKFVIFFDNQALPEYLVTFSVDQDEQ